ncbi:unnamed protein product [Pipistrellus nathusii]|uniref:Uncharacterized protein n=1 Tax=Pipistrellus nathusii TaxID=59473 RepID=A0ABN9ZQ50_PIPNA
METSALVAGPSLAPLRWGIKEPFPLGLRALSFIVSKPRVLFLVDAVPPRGKGPAFSTSSRAARRSYLCSCHLSYSVENSPRGSGPPALGCESKGLYLGPLSLSWSKLAMNRVEGTPQISSPLLHRHRRGDGKR